MLVGGGAGGDGGGGGDGGDGPRRLVERSIEPSKLRLAPELKREVNQVRREWTATTNALTMAMVTLALTLTLTLT